MVYQYRFMNKDLYWRYVGKLDSILATHFYREIKMFKDAFDLADYAIEVLEKRKLRFGGPYNMFNLAWSGFAISAMNTIRNVGFEETFIDFDLMGLNAISMVDYLQAELANYLYKTYLGRKELLRRRICPLEVTSNVSQITKPVDIYECLNSLLENKEIETICVCLYPKICFVAKDDSYRYYQHLLSLAVFGLDARGPNGVFRTLTNLGIAGLMHPDPYGMYTIYKHVWYGCLRMAINAFEKYEGYELYDLRREIGKMEMDRSFYINDVYYILRKLKRLNPKREETKVMLSVLVVPSTMSVVLPIMERALLAYWFEGNCMATMIPKVIHGAMQGFMITAPLWLEDKLENKWLSYVYRLQGKEAIDALLRRLLRLFGFDAEKYFDAFKKVSGGESEVEDSGVPGESSETGEGESEGEKEGEGEEIGGITEYKAGDAICQVSSYFGITVSASIAVDSALLRLERAR